MDFLNHREGDMVFYQVFFFSLYRNYKRLREFEEIESQGKAVVVTVNCKEEKPVFDKKDFGQTKEQQRHFNE
jgi:hypothetical protein